MYASKSGPTDYNRNLDRQQIIIMNVQKQLITYDAQVWVSIFKIRPWNRLRLPGQDYKVLQQLLSRSL